MIESTIPAIPKMIFKAKAKFPKGNSALDGYDLGRSNHELDLAPDDVRRHDSLCSISRINNKLRAFHDIFEIIVRMIGDDQDTIKFFKSI